MGDRRGKKGKVREKKGRRQEKGRRNREGKEGGNDGY